MQEQLRKEIDEVHAGSNFSNLGTQNISASKVEEAKATQTVTAHYPGGDFFPEKTCQNMIRHMEDLMVWHTPDKNKKGPKAHRLPQIEEHRNNHQ
jgi:hypothetical protein